MRGAFLGVIACPGLFYPVSLILVHQEAASLCRTIPPSRCSAYPRFRTDRAGHGHLKSGTKAGLSVFEAADERCAVTEMSKETNRKSLTYLSLLSLSGAAVVFWEKQA